MSHKLIYITGLSILLSLGGFVASAQPNIVKAEYFINEDPGFGLGIPIAITNGQIIDVNFIAATDTLSPGYHQLCVRTQNALGVWGYLEKRSFYVVDTVKSAPPLPTKIVALEYFIDNDPGQGLAIPIAVTTDFTVDIPALTAQTDTLSAGYHKIGVRAKTEPGPWGWVETRSFYVTTTGSMVVPPVQKIVDIEYYFDIDPGQGLATSLGPYSPNLTFDLNELIPTTLTTGYHTFNVRSKDENGHWGFVEQRPVYVISAGSTTSIADINKIEYYIDGADPGVGKATNLPITPGQTIELNPVDIPTATNLIDGQHTISVRARNANGWGMIEIDTFDVLDDCTQPIAAFSPSLACAGQSVTFVDNSTNTDSSATYRWYLNGDAIIDDTTIGNTTFNYPFPGTYVVALAIRQGTICFDSITTTIDIQPLPVAVFTASGTIANQPTTFTASASNLPAGAAWEWDFNEDNIIDATSSGSASFTYTTEGTFNPSLTITDNLGCSVTVTNPVIISAGSGGTVATPSIDFLPENGCVGNTISFIDLSQNIPVGSSYSWDFDGDGSEDTSATGSQTFSYSAKGSYTAKLTIDIGGSTLESTRTIDIANVPIADFSANDVCAGTAMDFTDLSTNIEPTAVYMWDIGNDGVIDSNAKTGVTYTFTEPGPHIVSLTIANDFGCTNTIVKQVNIIGLPTPDFEWGNVCTDETVSFNDLSTGIDAAAIYSWDLDGDGAEDKSATGDVSFTFTSNGSYNTTLTITNPAGCATTVTKAIEIFDRPEVALDIIAKCYGQESQMVDLSQKVSPSATYSWDFDSDGVEDDTTAGTTGFTYTSYNSYIVTLTIDNGGGCSGTNEQLVVFSDAATPNFSINKLCEGEPVVFTDLSTNLAVGALYSWDFNGDGLEDAATPGSTDHIYPSAGVYDATLIIDNGGNCLAYKTVALDVTPPPVVDLGPNLSLCQAGTVTFDAGTGYSSYLWPDGSPDQTFTTEQIGNYTVRVQDAKGCFNYDTISVALMGEPVPSFSHAIELSLEGIKVSFINNSTNADAYVWSFGDDVTSDEAEPSHIYSDFSFYATSVYTVCLVATNACEEAQICEDIFVSPTQILQEGNDEIKVYPNPAKQFVYVELSQVSQAGSKLALVDVQGKTLWFSNNLLSKHEIDISNLSKGVYYLILEQDTGFLYKKLMKN